MPQDQHPNILGNASLGLGIASAAIVGLTLGLIGMCLFFAILAIARK
jgi:tetrahydromethanopterin S-methyltransferase subunit F